MASSRWGGLRNDRAAEQLAIIKKFIPDADDYTESDRTVYMIHPETGERENVDTPKLKLQTLLSHVLGVEVL